MFGSQFLTNFICYVFQIILKDDSEGEAELQAKKSLNCEKRKNYKFDIAPVSCSGLQGDK